MNILMIVWSVYLTDSRVRRYAEALASRGNYVDIIALSPNMLAIRPNIRIINGVRVNEIDVRTKEKDKIDYVKEFIRFFFLSAFFATKLRIRVKYELLHIHTPPDFEILAALLPKILGAKVIIDIHDPMPDFFAAKFGSFKSKKWIGILKFIERMSVKFADHTITVTDYWKNEISARTKVPERKISVVLNLPDLQLFNINKVKRKQKTEYKFKLLYPGTINKHCGIDIVIRAVKIVMKQIPEISFEIYGKGSEMERIKAMSKEMGLENHVIFNKMVPLSDVPELMINANIGIALLSGVEKYAKQALNVKIFEFLAMGVPTIVTKTPATTFYLNDRVVMFSEANNPEDVARCIFELYRNPQKRAELSENGLQFVKNMNWNSNKEQYFQLVDNLVNFKAKNKLISETEIES